MFDFLRTKKEKMRLGLALGGGGAKGLVHIEFLKILQEFDIVPDIVSGTSIGALIGALYCSGISPRVIEEHYHNISLLEWGRLIDLSIPAVHGLVKGEKIIRYLSELGLTTFENLQIPLKVVATDFWNKEEVIITDGDLVQAVRASISIPGIFSPVNKNGKILTDGGAVNPVPYDIIRNECDLLVAIDVTGRNQPDAGKSEIPNIFESILNSFHIMESALLENKMAKSSPDKLYQPDIVNISIMDFNRYKEIIEQSGSELKRFRDDMINYKTMQT